MDGNVIQETSPVLEKYGYVNSLQQLQAQQSENENPFIQLLVTQLKNQDPLEPLQNGEFIQQLSSFAAVQETQALNGKLADMIALQQIVAGQNAFTQSAQLLGQTVTYLDPESGEESIGTVTAVELGDDGSLSLLIDGKEVPVSNVTGLQAQGEGSSGQDEDEQDEQDA